MRSRTLISTLARSLGSGAVDARQALERASRTLGRRWRWLRPLAAKYAETFADTTRPSQRQVAQFLQDDPTFQEARTRYRGKITIAHWIPEPPRMQPVDVASSWNVPALTTVADLADWLCLSIPELEWLADLKRLANKAETPKLRHYHYCVQVKKSGGVRLIEIPKSRLKHVQRRILSGLLDCVPAHPCVHGFVRQRSILSFAAPHVNKRVLLRLDLEDFFPTFPAARVQAVFRTLGYPDAIANLLGGLCTNSVPRDVWVSPSDVVNCQDWMHAKRLYAERHLPQGAPTSPALANIMAYHLDARLAGMAQASGATYTRYADDLAFSGGDDFARGVERFAAHAAAVALEEGFRVNHRKTRVMLPGGRQHLAGVVVNEKLNVKRRDYELLEAILTNCVRHGPASQNRANVSHFRAHLEGRIGFETMVHAEKGRKLRAIFDAIDWSEAC